MAAWPSFTWNRSSRRYVDARGRFVPRSDVRKALDAVVDGAAEDMRQSALDLQAGRIDLGQWQERMEASLKVAHVASGAAAAGGWGRATARTWSQVGTRLKSQYQYLRNFTRELANGLPLDGRFVSRADMYAISATGTYEAIVRRDDIAAGATEERRRLHSAESCPECVSYAAMGWVRAGTLPDVGQASRCLTRCRCSFETRGQSDRRARLREAIVGRVRSAAMSPAPAAFSGSRYVWTPPVGFGGDTGYSPGPASVCREGDLFCSPPVAFCDPPRSGRLRRSLLRRGLLGRLVEFARGRLPKKAHAGLGANCGVGPRGFLPGNTCSRKHGAHGTGRGGTNAHRAKLAAKIRALRKGRHTPEQRKHLADSLRALKSYERGDASVSSSAAAKIRRAIHAGKIPKSGAAIARPVAKPVKPPPTPPRPPTPKPATDRVAARVKRSQDRMDQLLKEHAPAAAEAKRAQAEYAKHKGSNSFTPERTAARDALFHADQKLRKIERELTAHRAYQAAVKERPSLVPPGPIAERLADYREGDAHLERVRAAVRPHADRLEAINRELDAGSRERTQALDEYDRAKSELGAFGPRAPKAKVRAAQDRHDQARARWEALAAKRDALRSERDGMQGKIRDAVAETLATDRPARIDWRHGPIEDGHDGPLTELDATQKAQADTASAWLSRVTRAGDGDPELRPRVGMATGQRAYHMQDAGGQHIAIDRMGETKTIVHELGHALESTVAHGGQLMGERGVEFLERRTAGEAPTRMLDVPGAGAHFKPGEVGRKDRFDSAEPDPVRAFYNGKSYGGGSSSEIVSMGVEKLFHDPLNFVNKDPEYAKFTIGLLTGDLR